MKIQSIMNIQPLIILKYMINNVIKGSITSTDCGNRAQFLIRNFLLEIKKLLNMRIFT